jgi:histidinol-phosphate aminotransferase
MLSCPPTFAMYEIDAQTTGTELVSLPREEDFSVDGDALISRLSEGDIDVVCLSNPNNPTGDLIPETLLISVLEATDALVLIDEAYFEFSRHTMRPHMSRHGNLVLLRTFSKAFSLAGLRVGYLLGREDVVRDIAKVRQPYSVDRFSQVAAALVFRERAVFESSIHETLRSRDLLVNGLSDLDGVTVFPSEANFVLFRVDHASLAWRDLLHSHSILVRDLSRVPGLEDCLRVTAGTQEECAIFLEAMDRIMSARRASEILGVTAVASRHEEDEEKEGGG